MRSRASEILDSTYWPATYPTPSTPAPMAKFVLFRRSQRLVADIMVVGNLALYYDELHRDSCMFSARDSLPLKAIGLVKHDIMLSQPSSREARQGPGNAACLGPLVVGHVAAWWDV